MPPSLTKKVKSSSPTIRDEKDYSRGTTLVTVLMTVTSFQITAVDRQLNATRKRAVHSNPRLILNRDKPSLSGSDIVYSDFLKRRDVLNLVVLYSLKTALVKPARPLPDQECHR